MTLSVCMVVKDAEKTLARALDSVIAIADEIIIGVDHRTQDTTREIAKKYTQIVFDVQWSDNFSTVRNLTLEKATKDWILVLDDDEVLSPEDHVELLQLMDDDQYVAYALKQVSYTNDTSQYNYVSLSDDMVMYNNYKPYTHNFKGYIFCNIIRLFRNHNNIRFVGAVHESVDDDCKKLGNVLTTKLWIHHYQFEEGMRVMKDKQLHYLNIYEKNIDTYPNKARACRDIGSIYYTHVKDYDKARHYFERSLSLDAHNKKTYIGLGMCYLHQQNPHAALQMFVMGLEKYPQDQQLHILSEHAKEAIEKFIKD
jgi:glycosyltransferase involved in cell wall biosynthesis